MKRKIILLIELEYEKKSKLCPKNRIKKKIIFSGKQILMQKKNIKQ